MSFLLLCGLALLWSFDGGNEKNTLALIIYLTSFFLLFLEIYITNFGPSNRVQGCFFTRFLVILMKPILIVNGELSQLVIILCFAQFIFLKSYLNNLKIKPPPMLIAYIVFLITNQYFYRTGHRQRFSAIQFGKAFLGFPKYNYYLHQSLVILNTYSSYFIGFFLLPCIMSKPSNSS